ncbi:hypothetical protein D9M71_474370 [compost metagenome]
MHVQAGDAFARLGHQREGYVHRRLHSGSEYLEPGAGKAEALQALAHLRLVLRRVADLPVLAGAGEGFRYQGTAGLQVVAIGKHRQRALAMGVQQLDHRQRVEHVALEDLESVDRHLGIGQVTPVLLCMVGEQQQRLSVRLGCGQEAFAHGMGGNVTENDDGPLHGVLLGNSGPSARRLRLPAC